MLDSPVLYFNGKKKKKKKKRNQKKLYFFCIHVLNENVININGHITAVEHILWPV